ncbi:hypothetical protein F5Y00DRAFT_266064 [Daldinia vernicosa]|uniref:uncharacterized protein n=1 Tax=Daldinia vernicosa TaxID=114800 RepID=UPI002007FC02|nr:uncharacterized protein F5Y00DRAFT_266064 [Daldinia vernicosa]KAI0844971.1 hypothetical protein F5Y00DRAFT_266064 [Daldinia vernicosa]
MWHSSTTQVWQNRWGGGEGYKDMFLRRGYPVYLWDGPRVANETGSQAHQPLWWKRQVFLLSKDGGLSGNTYTAFADINNDEVANLLDEILGENNFDAYQDET